MVEKSKTVTNAMRVLDCFPRAQGPLSVSEIARQVKLPRQNVLRVLASLQEFGFVSRVSEKEGYTIGARMFEMGMLYLRTNPLARLFSDALDALTESTQCPSYAGVLDGADVLFLNSREGTLPVQFIWKAGDRLPATTTALGKAILMLMPEEEIDAQLGAAKSFPRLTPKSIANRRQLQADLAVAKKRGWALAREESHAGLTGIGAPIIDEKGRAVAALSVSYLDFPVDPKRMEKFATITMRICAETSKRLQDGRVLGAHLTGKRP
jgi:DNA-binding IclR family transcriptional regulator